MANDGDLGTAGLEEQAHRYRLLLDILPHGVQENDCGGTITYSNRAHHALLGYKPGELLGKKIWDLLPSEAEQATLEAHFARLVREQPPPVPYLARNRRADGALVDLQIDWSYERAADGSLRGFVSVITDVTEQRRTEESLQNRTRGLATLLEASQRLAETLDTRTILQAAVDAVTGLVGLDTAAVYLLEGLALHLWATTPPLPPQFPSHLKVAPLADHPTIRGVLASGDPLVVEDFSRSARTAAERAVAEQRRLRTVLLIPLVVDKDAIGTFIVGSTGEPSPISAVEVGLSRTLANLSALAVRNARLYDEGQRRAAELQQALTERIRAEEERERLQAQLTQAQKMESIGRLAGGVAHDFNNMLSVILGHADLALAQLDAEHPLQVHLAHILDAAKHSANLTRQLLAFARRQAVDPKVVDLNRVVGEMLNMLRRLIGEDIDLVWEPGRALGSVRIDPSQVDQILANLCVNARDAISGVGRVTIATRKVVFADGGTAAEPGFMPGAYVMVAVSDDGCGMGEATLSHLFEPFFSTKEPGAGTGLGLATVYGIVKQNEGFIKVDSAPGHGTTFRIYLRSHDGEPAGSETEIAEPTPDGGGGTILLVEDEAMILELVTQMLESLGYRVLPANKPEAALAVAESVEAGVDLLLTDVVMPGMNGLELSERLRARFPRMRTLYMSGYTADVIANRGILNEGILLLSKPFARAELAARVREALAARPDG